MHSREEDSDEPRLKTGTHYKRSDKRSLSSSKEEDSVESRHKTKTRYKRSNKRGSGSSEEEDSGESRHTTTKRYKRSDKRGSSSRVEGESDDSASVKKKNRNTYTRCKKSTDNALSVKRSDSLVVTNVLKIDGSKKYNQKKNYCIFCWEPQSKIARHLERKHWDKMEVASAMMYAKNSKERRNQLDLLRKQGNRAHNITALTKGKGILVSCRQQSDGKSSPKDYEHCFACFGYFKRKTLWRHAKQCALAQNLLRTLPGKTRLQALCAAAQPAS